MRSMINSILRLVQFLLVFIATALVGNVRANSQHAAASATAAINFALFVCALAWIAVIYNLLANFISAVAIPIVSLALDGLATLFTFIGAVVLSAKLTTANCAHWGSRPSDWIAFGSGDTEKRCREIQAGLVFMWFLFATFAATLFLAFKEFRRGGGSVRGPSMSQIGV
ncbi:marvel domain-containing protein [Xylaria sp. FL0933]|nr:marvel domain-containing protein [Xylaria sp. FL0064]KAI1284117.1 marvel domain-containing protein [Xylaria sp. FL0933]KAI1353504.1 marvel domain-containing protein [Xylaria sp. FL0043]